MAWLGSCCTNIGVFYFCGGNETIFETSLINVIDFFAILNNATIFKFQLITIYTNTMKMPTLAFVQLWNKQKTNAENLLTFYKFSLVQIDF